MGANGGGASFEPGARPPCGDLHSTSGVAMVAACSARRTFHGFHAERSRGTTPGARNYQRPVVGICARKRAGSLGGRNGEVRARWIRLSVSNALHDERAAGWRPDERWTCIRQEHAKTKSHHFAIE